MTLEELKKSGHIIFECVSGSRSYGLHTPRSDTDIRGVFILPQEKFYSLDYVGQVNDETNDTVYFELRKFVELCANNNPNILELLNVPEHCVRYIHPLFKRFSQELFLSKRCELSFGNYAYSQIKKARGLEKKIVNPVDKERKSILDFCYVFSNGKTLSLLKYLEFNSIEQSNCGLTKLTHMRDCYSLFYGKNDGYKGIMKSMFSNEVSLSSIPKGEVSLCLMYFNQDGYSTYCKKYKEYWEWVEKRNHERYATTVKHGKNYDSKNMMHVFRLLHMAKEIALEKTIKVERPDRELLLAIKAGEYEYENLVGKAEKLKNELIEFYKKSDLPLSSDKKKIDSVLVGVRTDFYISQKQP